MLEDYIFLLGWYFFKGCWLNFQGVSRTPIPLDPVPVAMVPLNLVFTVLVEGISDRYGKVENSLDGLVCSKNVFFVVFLGGDFRGGD